MKEELTDFSFKLHGHKHAFQAGSKVERDSWFSAVETTATEAKHSREGVIQSDGYKKHMSRLGTGISTPQNHSPVILIHNCSTSSHCRSTCYYCRSVCIKAK